MDGPAVSGQMMAPPPPPRQSAEVYLGQPVSAPAPSVADSNWQAASRAFVSELHAFHEARGNDFKVPKFYGVEVDLLKLWRVVSSLGGFDTVTARKQWRVVGDYFNPPSTCTTLSWSFRGFYEKALLDYERHYGLSRNQGALPFSPAPAATPDEPVVKRRRRQSWAPSSGDPLPDMTFTPGDYSTLGRPGPAPGQLRPSPVFPGSAPPGGTSAIGPGVAAITPGPGSRPGGPHIHPASQPPVMSAPMLPGRQRSMRGVGSPYEGPEVDARAVAMVHDLGVSADWVKVNVRQSSECFEIYALVPGLLREEVRVQCDPAGKVCIIGQPERPDNPWGVVPFKKAILLPAPIVAAKTAAIVTLHGQLYIRAPLAQPAASAEALPGAAEPASTPGATLASDAAAQEPAPALSPATRPPLSREISSPIPPPPTEAMEAAAPPPSASPAVGAATAVAEEEKEGAMEASLPTGNQEGGEGQAEATAPTPGEPPPPLALPPSQEGGGDGEDKVLPGQQVQEEGQGAAEDGGTGSKEDGAATAASAEAKEEQNEKGDDGLAGPAEAVQAPAESEEPPAPAPAAEGASDAPAQSSEQ